MAAKRARDPEADDPAPQSTPKKLRFGEPATTPSKGTPTKGTPTKSAIKKKTAPNGTPTGKPPGSAAATPSNRGARTGSAYTTPSNAAKRKSNPTVQTADRSARRKQNRSLIERNLAGGQSDEEADQDAAEPSDGEDGAAAGRDAALPTTEEPGEQPTPSRRGRGRPPGAKNKRTPTPPPDLPAHEWYFFQNRPAAAKHSSGTPASVPLLPHAAYFAVARRRDAADPHAASLRALHDLHASKFDLWDFELRQGFALALHGYGSKRRLVRAFAEHVHARHGAAAVTVVAAAHHPAFSLRALLQAVARALGLEPADLPAAPAALLAALLAALRRDPAGPRVYLLVRTLTARQLTGPAALAQLAQLAADPRVGLVLTADNPAFPLLWPSATRDALNVVFHDATTFLPYDAADGADGDHAGEISELGTGAVDAVAELMGRRGAEAAGRERVRWVLQSLPENARGLYRIIVSEILAAADDEGAAGGYVDEDDDEMLFGEPAKGKKGKPAPKVVADELPAVDSKMVYQKASEEFLCSSEMAFRGLLREFLDHAMVVVRRDGMGGGGGGEMLGVEMGRAEVEGVLEDLVM